VQTVLSRHDSLTRLPNRVYFAELLDEVVARAGILAVLFIDLDRFKQVNDTLGYEAGDELLRAVAGRLRGLLREGQVAGRVASDEFAIGLTGQSDEAAALEAAEEYMSALREPYRIQGNELFVTASMGVAFFPQHGTRAVDLLHNADLAMHQAKNSGRDELRVFVAEDRAPGLERLQLENALRTALEKGEFDLVFQPVVSMKGTVDALEALLTWRHPAYGAISPRRFVPIAEETGLIVAIGGWVMRQACIQGARWRKAGYRKASISVNVSARQFERADFVDVVAEALALSGFPPEGLELELTETYVMRSLPESVRRMWQIRELGVSISIDDFGTGYSSLSYLSKLPVDTLKIDQSFLRRLLEPEGSLPVVQSIVRLAHGMHLAVVAEGVETVAELDLVRVLGCDKVQGHVYGPSLSRDEAGALLARKEALGLVSRC
jgi:diguanylate cyclase (GGDEF)-like protein